MPARHHLLYPLLFALACGNPQPATGPKPVQAAGPVSNTGPGLVIPRANGEWLYRQFMYSYSLSLGDSGRFTACSRGCISVTSSEGTWIQLGPCVTLRYTHSTTENYSGNPHPTILPDAYFQLEGDTLFACAANGKRQMGLVREERYCPPEPLPELPTLPPNSTSVLYAPGAYLR